MMEKGGILLILFGNDDNQGQNTANDGDNEHKAAHVLASSLLMAICGC